ncbi:hypothetical protein [Nocardioides dongkuii]|uniref:hypothetical protein n=1 Tax=Nocardioides dongkuii TaxID=2760089 RepID=UPI001877AA79|nr:hypothetical protein [Nocardioides dongkuii]
MRRLRALAAAGVLLLAAACSAGADEGGTEDGDARPAPTTASPASPAANPTASPTGSHSAHAAAKPGKQTPLRRGEDRRTLTMQASYTPSAPTGVGTDDYRCFLLDPELERDSWLTGTNVLPGNPDVVHHVILFRVPPEKVAEAEAKDAESADEGWTCFGGTGLAGEFANVDDAPWLGAWAPGGDEAVTRAGYGVDLPRGSRIIMQVHYNLLSGAASDVSSTQIRTMPRSTDLTPLHTFLMPAPVELPCRPGRDDGPLCDRTAAVEDAKARFGQGPGSTADILYFLCGGEPRASRTTSCTRRVQQPVTIIGAAGHMHLLGRSLHIEANPGTPEARTVLDIPLWDFDDQGSRPVGPIRLDTGDTVEITCTHSQRLRDKLPAFAGQQEKYVVWADGTTDEMCLGMLSVAFG